MSDQDIDAIAVALAGELRAAGWVVTKLPEPDYVDDDFDGLGTRGYGWGGVGSTPWGFGTYAASGRVYDDEREVSPKDARVVASWWLAAADAAEADQ